MNAPVITLTTDFGLRDPYVGIMKGVILGISPDVKLVDLCHDIRPQLVRQGAFLIGASFQFFPRETIHVVVIDPGVGTSRRALLLVTPEGRFLAPDNGTLSYVLHRYEGPSDPSEGLPSVCKAYALTNQRYWLHPVSSTFHGRDIFAPVAAHLSLGVPPEEFGPPIPSVVRIPLQLPRWVEGVLEGHIAHVDRFGNLVTDIPAAEIANTRHVVADAGKCHIDGLASAYAEAEGLLAIIGSLDYLEVSARDGSAAEQLGMGVGDTVRVSTRD